MKALKVVFKQGQRLVVVVAVVALLVGPQAYLSRQISRQFGEQSINSASVGLQIIDALQQPQQAQPVVKPLPPASALTDLLERVSKATVKIEVKLKFRVMTVKYAEKDRPTLDQLARGEFWPGEIESESIRWLRYLGSGFVIYSGEGRTSGLDYQKAPETLILTNYHIVEQEKFFVEWQFVLGKDAKGFVTFDIIEAWQLREITVSGFFGGDESFAVPLEVLDGPLYRRGAYADATLDLVVLKTVRPVGGLDVLKSWNDKSSLGQRIYVVGYPLGNPGPSVVSGIISVVKQGFGGSAEGWASEWVWNNLVQYDAETNPGNSGSVVINESGEIVGIVRGSEVQFIQTLQPKPDNPLWYDPISGRPLPPILPPWLRTQDKPTSELQWVDVAVPWPGMHYAVRAEAVMKWLRFAGLGFVIGQ